MTMTATSQDNTALARIGQIAINAYDVDRATAFYRDVLGLPHLFRAGQLSFFDCGGVRLMVGGRTCSASASSPSERAPPNTRTESAESCAGPMPLSRSRTRSRRSR